MNFAKDVFMGLYTVFTTVVDVAFRTSWGVVMYFLDPVIQKARQELQPYEKELQRGLNATKEYTEYLWDLKFHFLFGVVLATVLVLSMICFAILSYLAFYRFVLVIPKEDYIEKPLHFRFSPNERPRAYTSLKLIEELTSKQSYKFDVNLVLPESQVNYDIGMFMIDIRIFYTTTKSFNTIIDPTSTTSSTIVVAAKSERPEILRYKTKLLRILYTLFYSIPLLFGFEDFSEKQTLRTEMIPQFFTNPPDPVGEVVGIEVVLSSPQLQIQQANLIVEAQMSGLPYYCKTYFWTCFFIGTIIIFNIECMGVIPCIVGVGYYLWKKYIDTPIHQTKPSNSPQIIPPTTTTSPTTTASPVSHLLSTKANTSLATPTTSSIIQHVAHQDYDQDDDDSDKETDSFIEDDGTGVNLRHRTTHQNRPQTTDDAYETKKTK